MMSDETNLCDLVSDTFLGGFLHPYSDKEADVVQPSAAKMEEPNHPEVKKSYQYSKFLHF